MLAWELGCKGTTIYRNNCRQFQILNVGTGPSSATPITPSASKSSIDNVGNDNEEEDSLPASPQMVSWKNNEDADINNSYFDGVLATFMSTSTEEEKREFVNLLFNRKIQEYEKSSPVTEPTNVPLPGRTHCPNCANTELRSSSGCKQCPLCDFSVCDGFVPFHEGPVPDGYVKGKAISSPTNTIPVIELEL